MKPFQAASLLLLGAALFTVARPVQASSYYLHASQATGTDYGWNNTTTWFDQTSGGSNPTDMSGNDFYTNGYALYVRSATTSGNSPTNPYFQGRSLTLQASVVALLADVSYMKASSSATTWAPLTITGESSIYTHTAAGASATLNAGLVSIGSGSTLHLRAAYNTSTNQTLSITIAAQQLSGSGTLVTGGGTGGSSSVNRGIYNLNIADASNFTGTIEHDYGTLVFASATHYSDATFLINGGTNDAGIVFNADVSFETVSFTSFSTTLNDLEIGQTYTAAQLNAYTGTTLFSGAGTLTVVPEPSTYALMSVGAGLMLLESLRRRRARL